MLPPGLTVKKDLKKIYMAPIVVTDELLSKELTN